VVNLKIRFCPLETHTCSQKLAVPAANDMVLFRSAWPLFHAERWEGRPVRLHGLGLSGWEADSCVQQDLFDVKKA
jgi:DNA polymerase-4